MRCRAAHRAHRTCSWRGFMLQQGVVVANGLTLERPLGFGGMGQVWAARDDKSGEEVAIKFMYRVHAEDPRSITRFEREADALARIESPHLVKLLGRGVHEGTLPYIVMELLRGETLSTRLRRERRLPVHQVAELVVQ